ncbi:MAG: hypothetical protein M0Z80_02825, partial [Treponema sp.]|nr:hypothetical protein [Treponema sp.]
MPKRSSSNRKSLRPAASRRAATNRAAPRRRRPTTLPLGHALFLLAMVGTAIAAALVLGGTFLAPREAQRAAPASEPSPSAVGAEEPGNPAVALPSPQAVDAAGVAEAEAALRAAAPLRGGGPTYGSSRSRPGGAATEAPGASPEVAQRRGPREPGRRPAAPDARALPAHTASLDSRPTSLPQGRRIGKGTL